MRAVRARVRDGRISKGSVVRYRRAITLLELAGGDLDSLFDEMEYLGLSDTTQFLYFSLARAALNHAKRRRKR